MTFTHDQILDIRNAALSPQSYLHLSPTKNERSISKNGINADEDHQIFVYTHSIVADEIAFNQVFTSRYSVFAIANEGITGDITPDEVAELAHPWQRIIIQDSISPTFLTLAGRFEVDRSRPSAFWYYRYLMTGRTTEEAEKEFQDMRRAFRRLRSQN